MNTVTAQKQHPAESPSATRMPHRWDHVDITATAPTPPSGVGMMDVDDLQTRQPNPTLERTKKRVGCTSTRSPKGLCWPGSHPRY